MTVHGIPCIFPFTESGTIHTKCIPWENTTWCATAIQEDGKDWGYCAPDCQIER